MKPLLKLNDPAQFAGGIWLDTADNQPSLWRDATNVEFDEGSITKTGGLQQDFATAAPPSGLAGTSVMGVPRLYVGAGSQLLVRDGALPQVIGSGFAAGGLWSMITYGTWLFATNGINPPQIWKNAGVTTNIPSMPFPNARIVRKLEVFPMFFRGTEVCWPAYDNPEDFVPGPGKRAGQFFIRDLDGEIAAVEPLGENLLVYYAQDMYGFVRFVGGETAMAIKSVAGGIGAVGPNSVVVAGHFHFGLSRKGMWQFDGNSWQYLMPPTVGRWFNSMVDWSKAETAAMVHDEQAQSVSLFFTCKDAVRRGLTYTYAGTMQGRWSKLEMPVFATAEQGAHNWPLVGTSTGVSRFGMGNNMGADPLPASLHSAPLDMGSTDTHKRWQMLEVHKDNVIGLFEYRVGYSNSVQEVPDWTDWNVVQKENWLQDRESILLSVEFRSLGLGATWRLTGLEIHGVVTGRRR